VRARKFQFLDEFIANDPEIVSASRIAGNYDYRIVSKHLDFRSANEWAARMSSHPMVSNIQMKFCATVFDRSNYAAAILGSDDASAR
ncbi:MAG: hypothetical protein ABI655_15805, partial [Phenylobacterium sp.]